VLKNLRWLLRADTMSKPLKPGTQVRLHEDNTLAVIVRIPLEGRGRAKCRYMSDGRSNVMYDVLNCENDIQECYRYSFTVVNK
jgi:hypothetical protein